jgi:hypothetical protein
LHADNEMIELAVFVDKSATLTRFDEVANELHRAGLEVVAKVPTLGVIIGRCNNRDEIARFRSVRDVHGVRERAHV